MKQKAYLYVLLKFFEIVAIKREAKSLSAQWLSDSGRIHRVRETMHEATDGINSCKYFSKYNDVLSNNAFTIRIR